MPPVQRHLADFPNFADEPTSAVQNVG